MIDSHVGSDVYESYMITLSCASSEIKTLFPRLHKFRSMLGCIYISVKCATAKQPYMNIPNPIIPTYMHGSTTISA